MLPTNVIDWLNQALVNAPTSLLRGKRTVSRSSHWATHWTVASFARANPLLVVARSSQHRFLVIALFYLTVVLWLLAASGRCRGDDATLFANESTDVVASLDAEKDGLIPAAETPKAEPVEGKGNTPSQSTETTTTIIDCDAMSEIWEVSTRHLPDHFCAINTADPHFDVHQFENGCWQKRSIDPILVDDGRLNILYVHGNFMERNNARERVRILDGYVRRKATRPYRLIMFSWPSQRESKPLRDVFSNAESAECQSLYVAWLIDHWRTQQQVSILGFSFGARSVTGGLHLISGGQIPGLSYVNTAATDAMPQFRIGMVAPAIDRSWLTQCGRHRMALSNVEAMVNLYNSKDPILRRFRFIDRLSRPIAAGFAGFVGIGDIRVTEPLSGQSDTGQVRIRQYDCGSIIGTTHSERSYYGDCPYFGYVIDNLLWNDVP